MPGYKYERPAREDLEKRASRPKSNFISFIKDDYKVWKRPKDGAYIRLLPGTWERKAHWGYEIAVHYEVGPAKASVLCLAQMKKSACPVCEERARLELRKASKDEIAQYRYSKRFLAWILDRSSREEEDKGAQLWPMPDSVERDITMISHNERTGEWYYIDDPEEGYELSFKTTGEKKTTKYVGLQLERRPTSVPEKVLNFVVQYPLPTTLVWRDYDEVKKLLDGVGYSEKSENSRPPFDTEEKQEPKMTKEDVSLNADREALQDMTSDKTKEAETKNSGSEERLRLLREQLEARRRTN